MRSASAGVLLVLSIALAGGCGTNDSKTALRVEDLDFKLLPGGARFVSGTVHNDGTLPVNAAQVQISLFDDKNRRVDAMHAVIRDVPAGSSVVFREAVQSELAINGARVKSIILID
ncbi:MAG: FxLYD domain-containing protein [Rhodothermia bacterium]|nr:FxLYD domain-containing protein [Rhodothermia bacterium]